jgi:hypothetical protein
VDPMTFCPARPRSPSCHVPSKRRWSRQILRDAPASAHAPLDASCSGCAHENCVNRRGHISRKESHRDRSVGSDAGRCVEAIAFHGRVVGRPWRRRVRDSNVDLRMTRSRLRRREACRMSYQMAMRGR